MPEITTEQRKAALVALISGHLDYDYEVDVGLNALIAAGWGPVAAAEARGYRAGVEAALAAAHAEITEEDGVGTADMMIEAAIRTLADKPKEPPHG